MTSEKALQMLTEYRECLARGEYLIQLLEIKENQLAAARKAMLADAISISPKLSDMPRAQSTGDPTSMVALKFADGFVPDEVREIEADIRSIKVEINQRNVVVSCVNAWLNGLSEKERWIVEKHVIDGSYWRDITYEYSKRYGDSYTKEGLKRIKKAALTKIYRIAN